MLSFQITPTHILLLPSYGGAEDGDKVAVFDYYGEPILPVEAFEEYGGSLPLFAFNKRMGIRFFRRKIQKFFGRVFMEGKVSYEKFITVREGDEVPCLPEVMEDEDEVVASHGMKKESGLKNFFSLIPVPLGGDPPLYQKIYKNIYKNCRERIEQLNLAGKMLAVGEAVKLLSEQEERVAQIRRERGQKKIESRKRLLVEGNCFIAAATTRSGGLKL